MESAYKAGTLTEPPRSTASSNVPLLYFIWHSYFLYFLVTKSDTTTRNWGWVWVRGVRKGGVSAPMSWAGAVYMNKLTTALMYIWCTFLGALPWILERGRAGSGLRYTFSYLYWSSYSASLSRLTAATGLSTLLLSFSSSSSSSSSSSHWKRIQVEVFCQKLRSVLLSDLRMCWLPA